MIKKFENSYNLLYLASSPNCGSWVLQGFVHNISRVYQRCLKGVSWVNQGCFKMLARAVGVAVSRLATALVDCYFHRYFFPHHFPVATFSHRRSAQIKKLILSKLTGAPKNLGLDPFPDPVGHFGAPWRQFWILQYWTPFWLLQAWASAPGATRLVFKY